MSNSNGVLYVVATPIGNLQDLSPRAIETLKAVSLIWAEDTRHSRKLLSHFGINTPCRALHEHNERQMTAVVCEHLAKGEDCAIVSDAGTPLISDPGFVVVREAHQMGFKVSPIPGPSAAIAALSASGLPSDRFVFCGFLPAKSVGRRQKLESLREETGTMIFYESPRRLQETVQDMCETFGEQRRVVLARELTKLYETVKQLSLGELSQWLAEDQDQHRGEVVLLVGGAPPVESDEDSASISKLLSVLAEELPSKQAASIAAKITGQKKNKLYDEILKLKNSSS